MKNFIPIFKSYYSDELFYSWIHRLVSLNLLSLYDFMNSYLGKNVGRNYVDFRYDDTSIFMPFCDHILNIDNPIETYLKTSVFPYEALFMTEGQQTRMVQNVFWTMNKLNNPVNSTVQNVKLCPLCMKEDTETYGEPYFHRSHQLSGVETCHKHHKMLYSFKGTFGHATDYNLSDYKEIASTRTMDSNSAFTDYAVALFSSGVDCNIKILKDITYGTLRENQITALNGYAKLKAIIDYWKYRSLIDVDIDYFLKIKMIQAEYVEAKEIIPFLMLMFPDVEALIAEIRKREKYPIIKTIVCHECGKTYVTTPFAEETGFGCPHCNEKLPEQAVLERILNKNGYELKSEFVSVTENVLVYHEKCGQTIKMLPRKFIFDGTRCPCENIVGFQEAKNTVEKDGKFELLEFKTVDAECKIKATECGHVFEVRYRKFIKSQKCRICNPKNMNTELLVERIRKQSNGEFELVGEFVDQNTKVKLRHCTCGHIMEYYPKYIQIPTCPYCHSSYRAGWDKMFALLLQYKEEFGTTEIPKRNTYKGEDLGLWCNRMRQAYKEKKKTLTDEKIEKLRSIGFVFDPLEEEWERRYHQYKRYIEQMGQEYIARRTNFEGEHLGAWVETQRKWIKTGKMSNERKSRLLTIAPHVFDEGWEK